MPKLRKGIPSYRLKKKKQKKKKTPETNLAKKKNTDSMHNIVNYKLSTQNKESVLKALRKEKKKTCSLKSKTTRVTAGFSKETVKDRAWNSAFQDLQTMTDVLYCYTQKKLSTMVTGERKPLHVITSLKINVYLINQTKENTGSNIWV